MTGLGLPAVTVEIGFGQSIGTALDDVDWTDVTDQVLAASGLTCTRGRAVAGEAATAGQLTVTFDNDDGDFTPGRVGGTYGTITTRVPVRVTGWLIDGGLGGDFDSLFPVGPFDGTGTTAYPMWTGFVTDWSWASTGGAVTATLEAADMIGATARATVKPWMSGTVLTLQTGLVDYWPLDDAEGTYSWANRVEGRRALVADNSIDGTITSGVVSDLDPDNGTVTALTPGSATSGAWLTASADTPTGEDLAASVWVRPSSNTVGGGLLTVQTPNSTVVMAVYYDSDGRVRVNEGAVWFDDPGSGMSVTAGVTGVYGPAGAIPTGEWSHVYVERDYSETGSFAARFRVWVNGSELSLVSGGASVSSVAPWRWKLIVGYLFGVPATAQFAHVATWGQLDSARATVLADNGTGEPTAAGRFTDLARLTVNEASLSTWLTADTSALTPMSAQSTTGKSFLQVAQEVADTCNGQLIVTRDGLLRLVSSRWMVTPADPVLTLSAQTDVLGFDGAFGIDDTDAVSEATITQQPAGVTFVRRQTDPGLAAVSRDAWTTSSHVTEALADAAVAGDGDTPRAPVLSLSMEWLTHAGLADDLLTLDLGDRITVTDLPASAPASSVDLAVISIDHAITSAGWTVTLGTSAPISGWILGDPDLGLLGSTTILRA